MKFKAAPGGIANSCEDPRCLAQVLLAFAHNFDRNRTGVGPRQRRWGNRRIQHSTGFPDPGRHAKRVRASNARAQRYNMYVQVQHGASACKSGTDQCTTQTSKCVETCPVSGDGHDSVRPTRHHDEVLAPRGPESLSQAKPEFELQADCEVEQKFCARQLNVNEPIIFTVDVLVAEICVSDA